MSGTYVGLRLLPQSAAVIRQFCRDNGIEIKMPEFEQRLHVTLIYSRKHFKMIPNTPVVHTARIVGFELFSNDAGERRVLVANLDAKSVSARHSHIREMYGATHDYPDFRPHITLVYDWDPAKDFSKLIVPSDTIFLSDEYVEELKLHWSEQIAPSI